MNEDSRMGDKKQPPNLPQSVGSASISPSDNDASRSKTQASQSSAEPDPDHSAATSSPTAHKQRRTSPKTSPNQMDGSQDEVAKRTHELPSRPAFTPYALELNVLTKKLMHEGIYAGSDSSQGSDGFKQGDINMSTKPTQAKNEQAVYRQTRYVNGVQSSHPATVYGHQLPARPRSYLDYLAMLPSTMTRPPSGEHQAGPHQQWPQQGGRIVPKYIPPIRQRQPLPSSTILGGQRSTELRSRWDSLKTPPVVKPQPTRDYLAQVSKEPVLLSAPQPLLIVFDLNGTLLYRGSRKSLTSFVPRPGLAEFINWLMDAEGKHAHRHRVMIWSSAKPENVGQMVNKLFTAAQVGKLAAVWARDKLGLTAEQYANKVQVYKELSKVWKDPSIQEFYPGYGYPTPGADGEEVWVEEEGWWDQTNTVLVDDTVKKALSEPHNLLQIPEFVNSEEQKDDTTLAAVRMYIEEIARYADVSAFIKRSPFSEDSVRKRRESVNSG